MGEVLFVIVTVSDSCSNGTAVDHSGLVLEYLIRDNYPNCSIIFELVADEQNDIEKVFRKYCKMSTPTNLHVILSTGGTGFSPRDVTPEATKSVIKRECPQLSLAMSLESFKKTPFAALSRAICGICDNTLIINMPGSPKAVKECFEPLKDLLPHIVHLMSDQVELVKAFHKDLLQEHVCPHKTGDIDNVDDRNSPFPMLPVNEALKIMFSVVSRQQPDIRKLLLNTKSPVDIPPFRASIKDGYALKSTCLPGIKKVLGMISAGDETITACFADDECYKINTGAPLPEHADCIIQIEDTKLLKKNKNGDEDLVEIFTQPKINLDVRPIGCDLKQGSILFPSADFSDVSIQSILASVGTKFKNMKPKIGVISTGSELIDPESGKEKKGKIFDSNTTMLMELIKYFGFECIEKMVVNDDFGQVKKSIVDLFKKTDFIICTGGVSMGDRDYIKPVLNDLDFEIHFGRVNMKPGKPMTFASKNDKYFFGLPGNPVSAFVTFHIFVLPAIRWSHGWDQDKCGLATLEVTLETTKLLLDPRPEYVRAQITNKNGKLYANVTSNQMSSRLQSICGADVLLHLPGRNDNKKFAVAGDILKASIIRYDFISKYE